MRPEIASAIRAHLAATLEQRDAGLQGEARRALDARLAELRAAQADAPAQTSGASPGAAGSSRLRELVDRLARNASPGRAAYPAVPALADLRQLWSTLRADSQLQQSIAHTPTDAGPLNSIALASRAVALMHELSPQYLRSFLAYVDDLAWLEQLAAGTPSKAGAAATRTRARRKPPAG